MKNVHNVLNYEYESDKRLLTLLEPDVYVEEWGPEVGWNVYDEVNDVDEDDLDDVLEDLEKRLGVTLCSDPEDAIELACRKEEEYRNEAEEAYWERLLEEWREDRRESWL